MQRLFRYSMLCCLLLAGFTPILPAQVSDILLRSMHFFQQRPNLTIDMDFKMFQAHGSDKIIQEFTGYYQTMDGMLLVKMGPQTQLFSNRYTVIVDEGSKTMLLQDKAPPRKNETPLGVDSLVSLFKEIKITGEQDGVVTLSFTGPKSSFYTVNRFDLHVERSSGKVLKAILFYAFNLQDFYSDYTEPTVPRIEITYTQYKENSVTAASFDETRYVSIGKGNVAVSGNYPGYRLMDLRKNK